MTSPNFMCSIYGIFSQRNPTIIPHPKPRTQFQIVSWDIKDGDRGPQSLDVAFALWLEIELYQKRLNVCSLPFSNTIPHPIDLTIYPIYLLLLSYYFCSLQQSSSVTDMSKKYFHSPQYPVLLLSASFLLLSQYFLLSCHSFLFVSVRPKHDPHIFFDSPRKFSCHRISPFV